MIVENQFAVYQMRQMLETRQIRFRSYQSLQEKGIRIRQEDYEQVYTGTLYPQDTPEGIRERLDRQPPRSFAGHSVSVSDVMVINRMGTVISYYVEKTGFTVIDNFIKNESSPSGFTVSIDTTNFHIEVKAGSWLAFDSIRMEGQEFFLMEHDQETGQYYLRARYYNPVIGRFTQEDTYRGDGLNLYAYCGNNLVMYYDPSGHMQLGYGDDYNEVGQTRAAGINNNSNVNGSGQGIEGVSSSAKLRDTKNIRYSQDSINGT